METSHFFPLGGRSERGKRAGGGGPLDGRGLVPGVGMVPMPGTRLRKGVFGGGMSV